MGKVIMFPNERLIKASEEIFRNRVRDTIEYCNQLPDFTRVIESAEAIVDIAEELQALTARLLDMAEKING